MNSIKIVKSKERCSCDVCKCYSISPYSIYELTIGSINVCLCKDCYRKLRIRLNSIYLNEQVAESE